jgi:glycosyltransferase involved in cell wall biosynthesis
MRVSVVISNYNYGHFLKTAIDSALQQTYAEVEVIVVDDGSTDDSKEVIERASLLDNRVQAIFKPNGGQASSINAGFGRSTGDVVFFLDADDALMPDAAERVVEALERNPDAAKVHFHLDIIDADGMRLGRRHPAKPLPSGNLAQDVVLYSAYGWAPTSGNAYARTTLARLLPVPEIEYRISADHYLNNLAPLLGPVVALREAGGCYRQHGNNNVWTRGSNDIDDRFVNRIQAGISRMSGTRARQLLLAEELGLPLPKAPKSAWRVHARLRLLSLRFRPKTHPIPGDSVWRAGRDGAVLSLLAKSNPGTRLDQRLVEAAWFAAVACAPAPAARAIVKRLYCQPI